MRKDAPLAVQVPTQDRDHPGWAKVGAIAAVGFVIGIAWPRVMGVKLGPSAPGEATASTAPHAKAVVARAPDVASASASAAPKAGAVVVPSASVVVAAIPAGPPQVSVRRGSVLRCKTTDGETKKGKECGGLTGLDSVVPPQLRKLATCSAAEGQTGKLSFVATAIFPSGGLSWDIGRSSTVGNIDGITGCLKTHFSGVTASGVAHEHNRYTVAYTVTFAPPSATATATARSDKNVEDDASGAAEKNAKDESGDKPAAPATASGEASVGWEVALVRDVPKTGAVVARLPRGTKVKVGPVKDGWYTISYGDAFASTGFVYRGAIGR